MYTALMLLALGGGGEPKVTTPTQPVCESCDQGNCNGCAAGRFGHRRKTWKWGMMPQTCYDPSYGCYSSSRFMNRYPAFHGTYYRRPYNYRQLYDYPWHAAKHEPTSMFSYNVESQTEAETGSHSVPLPPPPQARRTPRRAPRLR